MRKLILILGILFIGSLNAQIINPQSVVIGSSGGGITNPDAIEVDQLSDLTAVGSQNKDLLITTNLTLPAGNTSIASGAKLVGYGGVIDATTNSSNIIFTNNSFDSKDIATFINLGQNGTIDNSSTFSNGDMYYEWFGLVFDWVDTGSGITGTDNFNVLRQAAKIHNIAGGTGRIGPGGDFGYNSPVKNPIVDTAPTGWYLSGIGTKLIIDDASAAHVLPNNLDEVWGFSVWGNEITRSRNNYVKGKFVGDMKYHTYSGTYDGGNHGVYVTGEVQDGEIDVVIEDFTGDCVGAKQSLTAIFFNATGIVEANFTKDFDILANGTFSADTNWAYSTLFDIQGTEIEDYGQMAIGGNFAQQGEQFYRSNVIKVAWYDATDTFLEITELVDLFQPIFLDSTYKKFRVVMPTPDVWGDVDGTVFSQLSPRNITWKGSWQYCQREGMSNGPGYSILKDVHIANNGRNRYTLAVGSPGFGANWEDGYQLLNNILLTGNTFQDNARGPLILKGTKYMKIIGNTFDYSTNPEWVENNTFSTANGHFTIVSDNYFKDVKVFAGRSDKYSDNMFWDVVVSDSGEEETFTGNTFYNSNILENPDGSYGETSAGGGNSYWENNKQFFTRNDDVTAISWTKGDRILKDHVIDYNNITYTGSISTVNSSAEDATGYIDGFEVRNYTHASGAKDNDAAQFYTMDISNMTMPVGFVVRGGNSKDVEITNLKVPFVEMFPAAHGTTDGGDPTAYDTFTFINPEIIVDDSAYLDAGREMIYTRSYDYNIIINCGKIWYEGASGSNEDDFFQLNHYGTATFNQVDFRSTGTTIGDLTSVATCDTITFNGCTFNGVALSNGVNVTLRAGDVIN